MIWKLYEGRRALGWELVQDEKFPSMWRVKGPDGTLSDMVNLTRAKDAGRLLAGRGQVATRFQWKATQARAEDGTARFDGTPYTPLAAAAGKHGSPP